MTTLQDLQDQYTAFARQGQEATASIIDAWSRSFQDAAARFPAVTAQATSEQAVDQIFDLAVSLIDVQRNLTKQFVTATTTMAEDVASRATDAANDAAEAVTKAGRVKKTAA